MVRFHFCEVLRLVRITETEYNGGCQGSERGMGSCFLLVYSVSQDEESSGNGWWCWLHNIMNLFNTIKLCLKVILGLKIIYLLLE